MVEKMHLFGLLSPIFHRAEVKEVKDGNIEEIYISILLSLLSPPLSCAPRFDAFFLRICAGVGERGKEAPIDAPASLRRLSHHVCAGSNISLHCGQGYGHALERNVGECQSGQHGQDASGSFPGTYAPARSGNGQEDSFCLLRVANTTLKETWNMEVKLVSIDDVKPYESNPRINDAAVDAVATSLKEFGFRQPIVVDEHMVIICGHTRWKAARKLGLAKVPVHIAKDLTAEQVKAYRIADNKTGELAEWNMDLLPIELKDLQSADFDLSMLGFDEEELAHLLDGDVQGGLADPDSVPAPPDEAITRKGDLWLLGSHRLLCGDSSVVADVDRLLDGALIQLVNTDPPYNVCVAPRSNNAVAKAMATGEKTGQQGMDIAIRKGAHATTEKMRPKDRPLANDFVSDEEFARLLRAWFGNIQRVLEPGRAFYIWGGYSNIWNYPNALKECELYFSQMIIWDKQHPVLTRKDFMGAHEWCFYGWKEGAAHKFFGPANVTDLWHVKKVNPQSMVHLTEKPVELAVRAIQYSSLPGENVLDLFGGSGSTLIGCEQTGRKAHLMEIDPPYADVIVNRWEQFTGKKAERIAAKDVVEVTA